MRGGGAFLTRGRGRERWNREREETYRLNFYFLCHSPPSFCQVRLENRPESSNSGRLAERLLKLAGGREDEKDKERRRERSKERTRSSERRGKSSEKQSRRDHSEERRRKRSPTREKRGRREESGERRSGRRGESEEKRSRREASRSPVRKAKRSPSPVVKKSIRDRLGPSTNGSGNGSPRPESRGVKDRLGAVKEETRNGGRNKVGSPCSSLLQS